jgi:hypothetical protein
VHLAAESSVTDKELCISLSYRSLQKFSEEADQVKTCPCIQLPPGSIKQLVDMPELGTKLCYVTPSFPTSPSSY